MSDVKVTVKMLEDVRFSDDGVTREARKGAELKVARGAALRLIVEQLAAPVGWTPTAAELKADAQEVLSDLESRRGDVDADAFYSRPPHRRVLDGVAAAVKAAKTGNVGALLEAIGRTFTADDPLWGVAEDRVVAVVAAMTDEQLGQALTEYTSLGDRARQTRQDCERIAREMKAEAANKAWLAGRDFTEPDTADAQMSVLKRDGWLGSRFRRRLGIPDGLLSASFAMGAVVKRLAAIRAERTRRLTLAPTKELVKILDDVAAAQLKAAERAVSLEKRRALYRRAGLLARAKLEPEIATLAAEVSALHTKAASLLAEARDTHGWAA